MVEGGGHSSQGKGKVSRVEGGWNLDHCRARGWEAIRRSNSSRGWERGRRGVVEVLGVVVEVHRSG